MENFFFISKSDFHHKCLLLLAFFLQIFSFFCWHFQYGPIFFKKKVLKSIYFLIQLYIKKKSRGLKMQVILTWRKKRLVLYFFQGFFLTNFYKSINRFYKHKFSNTNILPFILANITSYYFLYYNQFVSILPILTQLLLFKFSTFFFEVQFRV